MQQAMIFATDMASVMTCNLGMTGDDRRVGSPRMKRKADELSGNYSTNLEINKSHNYLRRICDVGGIRINSSAFCALHTSSSNR